MQEMTQILTLLFHLFLICKLQIQGSSAVTDVFVKTGDDLILNLTEAEIPQNSRLWLWQFTGEAMIKFSSDSPPDVLKNYTGRIEVLDKKYSVKLKNLQKSHNGIYSAKVILPTEKILIEYNIIVQDPVSPVNLSFTCASSSFSSFYFLTLTCRTDDSSISITLRCEDQTCNQEEGEGRSVTKSGSSLHIYQLQESVVCNHSNQVSRNESKVKIENRCVQQPAEKRNTAIINVTRIILAALLVVVFTLTVVIRKCKRKTKPEEVMYEFPEVNSKKSDTRGTRQQNPAADSADASF